MSKKDEIDSHIFIPKSILNRFARIDKKNRKIINYIDCNDMQIKSSTTASFNTQLGYYSKQNEKILSDESESKIGNVIRKIQDIDENTVLNEKDIKYIFKYLSYQILRTEIIPRELNKRFGTNLNSKFIKNEFIKEEVELNTLYNVVKNEDIHVIINNSNVKFVLPTNSMYTFNPNSNENTWILVLSPNIAVSFMPKGTIKELSKGKDSCRAKILEFGKDQENIINSFNLRAIGTQCKDSSRIKCVIGLEKELNNLMDIISKNKE